MRRVDCAHEPDVLEAVYTNRWPDRVDADLRAHVATCQICADVVTIAPLLEADADLTRAEATVPESGLVWWRAQMRAREEAARTAVRPITVAQAVGLAATVGVVGAVFGASATWFQHAVSFVGEGVQSLFTSYAPQILLAITTALTEHYLLFAGGVACVLLTPLAVYVALRESER
jgi:hypothetical protein